jgi:hypothetical protein
MKKIILVLIFTGIYMNTYSQEISSRGFVRICASMIHDSLANYTGGGGATVDTSAGAGTGKFDSRDQVNKKVNKKVDTVSGSRLITTAEINQIHRSQVDSIRANITTTLTITFAHQLTVYLRDTISGNLTISSSFDASSKLGDVVIINLIGSGGGRSITSYAGAYKVEGSADYDDTAGRRQQIVITRESNGLLSRYVKFW